MTWKEEVPKRPASLKGIFILIEYWSVTGWYSAHSICSFYQSVRLVRLSPGRDIPQRCTSRWSSTSTSAACRAWPLRWPPWPSRRTLWWPSPSHGIPSIYLPPPSGLILSIPSPSGPAFFALCATDKYRFFFQFYSSFAFPFLAK